MKTLIKIYYTTTHLTYYTTTHLVQLFRQKVSSQRLHQRSSVWKPGGLRQVIVWLLWLQEARQLPVLRSHTIWKYLVAISSKSDLRGALSSLFHLCTTTWPTSVHVLILHLQTDNVGAFFVLPGTIFHNVRPRLFNALVPKPALWIFLFAECVPHKVVV